MKTGRRTAALVILAAACAWAGLAPPAAAAASPWAETDHTAVRLVSSVGAVGDAEQVALGLHFRLAKDWKIYWRSPGDAGYPPHLDWAGSDNLAEAAIQWPVPRRFSILGFETLGYTDEVVLPVAVRLAEPGRPLTVRAAVNYLACADICVPYEADLALDLPAGPAAPTDDFHLIGRYQAKVPRVGAAHGLQVERAVASGTALEVAVASATPMMGPDVYLEGPETVAFGPPAVDLADGGRRAVLRVAVHGAEDLEGGLAGTPLTVTVVDGEHAAERRLVVAAGSPGAAPPAPPAATPLLTILLLALLGGLILNLMPCVLPVLSIKLLGVIGHGGGDRRVVRLSFLASAAGILASFLVLAGALLAVKSAGATVGWGIQFQQPWFLVAMTLVVGLFACNLWGFFEVRLPLWLADLGEHASHVHGLGGHVLSGALATLLATPCSAPFLGTAVGFALSRGAFEVLAVFTALGVGLALPYLAVAAVPALATRLPRPGPWMVRLRQILGFALAATAVWLVTVLAAEVGTVAAGAVAALVVVAGAALYLRHRWDGARARAAVAATTACAVLAFAVPTAVGGSRTAFPDSHGGAFWQPFDPAAIPALVADGQVVLVDVTAEWCITCQVNKTFVLEKGRVAERLSADGVVAMQADWTRPDDAIARYLAGFGRYGIPFDAVYGPGLPDGLALPELLTGETVLEALDRAAAGPVAAR